MALPSYYTNRSAPLGPVDTSAADQACQAAKGHGRVVCLADLLKKDLSSDLLARLQLPYAVADAKRWSNLPPMGYRNRVGPLLAEFVVDAVARRDQVRILVDGLTAANDLGLTTAVPSHI